MKVKLSVEQAEPKNKAWQSNDGQSIQKQQQMNMKRLGKGHKGQE
jgi:hypothetical protein